MKKMLLIAVTAGLLSSSLMAGVGTVKAVKVKSSGDVFVTLVRASDNVETTNALVGTAEAIKVMTAIALTAKSIGANTNQLNFGTYDSKSGWASVEIK